MRTSTAALFPALPPWEPAGADRLALVPAATSAPVEDREADLPVVAGVLEETRAPEDEVAAKWLEAPPALEPDVEAAPAPFWRSPSTWGAAAFALVLLLGIGLLALPGTPAPAPTTVMTPAPCVYQSAGYACRGATITAMRGRPWGVMKSGADPPVTRKRTLDSTGGLRCRVVSTSAIISVSLKGISIPICRAELNNRFTWSWMKMTLPL